MAANIGGNVGEQASRNDRGCMPIAYLRSTHPQGSDHSRRKMIIFAEPFGIVAPLRQRDVAIRPDEIERVALDPGSPYFCLPRKYMERNIEISARFGHAGL